MTMSAIGSTTPTSSSGSTSPDQINNSLSLSPTDFVQFLITEMQNQDPLDPTSSDQMLSQMSEIGQLQSSTDLDTDLQGLTLQNQVNSASSLIGKAVTGIDPSNNPATGVVTGVNVTSSTVTLQLDSGDTMSLGSVTNITDSSGASTTSGS
jgi:flagellar basal-body rod modification protein FlgD